MVVVVIIIVVAKIEILLDTDQAVTAVGKHQRLV